MATGEPAQDYPFPWAVVQWLHGEDAQVAQPTSQRDTARALAGVLDFGAMATGDPAYDVTAAWHLLDPPARGEFLTLLGADDATCRRACGLIVSGAVFALPYYLHTNPSMVAVARRGLDEVLGDMG